MSHNTQDGFICYWNALSDEVSANAISKGWYDSPREDGTMLMLVVSELAEAVEALRSVDPGAPDKSCPNFSNVEVELADAVIRLMDFARMRGFRLSEAMIDKIEFNKSRPRMHGGKKF
jgi:NTP pyrophosphatase (non-canonical NTP hydrolase)